MANNLTGDFDAVFQIRVRRINGILATMHQSKINPNASPTFEHSSSIRLGDLPKVMQPDTLHFAQWFGGVVRDLRDTGVSASDARLLLSEKAPPGVSTVLKKGWRDLDIARVEPVAGGAVRGFADVQLSAPKISLSAGTAAEATIHVWVRAHYTGSTAMPEPIHGEVRATYTIKPKTLGAHKVLSVQVSSHDNQIQFIPRAGSGLSAAEADVISAQVRQALRNQFAVDDVPLPDGFPFAAFTALGSDGDPGQALALPLQISGAAAAGNINSVTNNLLGGFEFAIAVSKEYVTTKFAPTLDKLRQIQKSFDVSTPWPLPDPTYYLSVTGADLQFKNGSIDLVINAKAITHYIGFPNYDPIGVTQRLTLVLMGQSVILQASDSDLTITGITGLYSGTANSRAKTQIIDERNKALPAAQATLTQVFQDILNQLNEALAKFDRFASASYKAVEINPDGIILRGAVAPSGAGWRLSPVVDFVETTTADGPAYTAFGSWIPGGRIEMYRWTWPAGGSVGAIVAMKIGKHPDEDRFVLLTPPDVAATGRICLRIEGSRTLPDGSEEQVTGGETCKPWWSEPILVAPYGSLDVLDPIWNPPNVEQPLDFTLDDAIAGHVSVVGQSRSPNELSTNTLIHFTGKNFERPLQTMSQALSQMRRPHMSLVLTLVLPTGTFATRVSELQARLGSLDERFSRNLRMTEDYAGGWTKAFAAPDGPSTYLINARGEFVWKQEGKLEGSRLAAALDEHLVPAPAPRSMLLRLTVQPGERAPDGAFQDDQGDRVTLRRLRGQSVLLNFWKSWSAPCIRELRRLQTLQAKGIQDTGRAPVIIAVNGGDDRAVLAEVRRQNNLTFSLVPDPDRSIGALYGVQCWPTTVSINQEGFVDGIQFGLSHEDREGVVGERS
jgi:peroxiredoxin